MTRSTIRALGVALLLVPAALAACAEQPETEVGAQPAAEMYATGGALPQEVLVRTRDYSFDAPDTIQSGATTFRLINEGPELHHVQLVRLLDGKTMEDLGRHMAAGGPPPAWMVEVGGPNTPNPGAETNGSVELEPGEYALLCVIPSPDGQLHIAKGMAKPLTVVPATGPTAALPAADVTMVLDDYSFQSVPEIRAGRRTIRVENRAAQPHEVVIARLAPGKTAADLLAWAETMQGPPPAEMVGGTTGIGTGGANVVTIDFTPGEYALLCFVPDAGDGRPHVAHGMVRQITVS